MFPLSIPEDSSAGGHKRLSLLVSGEQATKFCGGVKFPCLCKCADIFETFSKLSETDFPQDSYANLYLSVCVCLCLYLGQKFPCQSKRNKWIQFLTQTKSNPQYLKWRKCGFGYGFSLFFCSHSDYPLKAQGYHPIHPISGTPPPKNPRACLCFCVLVVVAVVFLFMEIHEKFS